MADETTKEIIIVDLQIKTDDVKKETKEVEALTGSIVGLRKANKELRAERDKMDTTTEQGIKRIQELNAAIEKNDKAIKENSTALEKQRLNVGNYTDSINKSVPALGAMISGIKSMINPITAGIAVLGGLAAAYAKSSTGARDLARAQDILKFASTSFFEGLGKTLGGGNDGISGAMLKFVGFFSESAAAVLGTAARAGEELRKLNIEYQNAAGFAKTFESAAETARRIRDDGLQSIEKRLKSVQVVEDNLNASKTVRINVLEREITLIKNQNADWQTNIGIQEQLASKRREISDIEEEINGKMTENAMAQKALLAEIEKVRQDNFDKQKERDQEEADRWYSLQVQQINIELERIQKIKDAKDAARKEELEKEKDQQNYLAQVAKQSADKELEVEQLKNDALAGFTDQMVGKKLDARNFLAVLFKKDAIQETVMNTYNAAVAAYKSLAGIPIVGPILGAAAAAAVGIFGAGQVAKMAGINFFAKGGEVGGKSHAQGGTKYFGEDGKMFEVERGEGIYVLKRDAQADTINRLSALNQMHGGSSFGKSTWYAAQGGQIETRNISGSRLGDLDRIVRAIQGMNIFVAVEDINAGQARVGQIQQRAIVI